MKKILLFLVISFFALSINAQNVFQNPGFENWTGTTPNNWNTLGVLGVNLSNITSSSESHSGNYAVSIGAKQLSSTIATMLGISQLAVPGLLTNATIDMTSLLSLFTSDSMNLSNEQVMSIFTNGTILTERPTSVNGYFSWNPIDNINEIPSIMSFVVSEESGTREIVGVGIYSPSIPIDSKATYTSFECPIIYSNQNTPTELIFIALTTSLDTAATTFGNLLLDDLSITTEAGLNEVPNNSNNSYIYPNPSRGEFRLNVKSQVEVSVYNQLGQVVVPSMIYNPNKTIKIGEKGVYFVRVKDNNSYKTQKLIIK
ncbi:MAG: T9SS type A sorting domain-containing protein [Bacteroidales bacterium]|jgi:hypothetical protein